MEALVEAGVHLGFLRPVAQEVYCKRCLGWCSSRRNHTNIRRGCATWSPSQVARPPKPTIRWRAACEPFSKRQSGLPISVPSHLGKGARGSERPHTAEEGK